MKESQASSSSSSACISSACTLSASVVDRLKKAESVTGRSDLRPQGATIWEAVESEIRAYIEAAALQQDVGSDGRKVAAQQAGELRTLIQDEMEDAIAAALASVNSAFMSEALNVASTMPRRTVAQLVSWCHCERCGLRAGTPERSVAQAVAQAIVKGPPKWPPPSAPA